MLQLIKQEKTMSVIEETNSNEVLRVHCAGVFKWVVEDWMINQEKETKNTTCRETEQER